MWLSKTVTWLSKVIHPVIYWVNNLGVSILFVMMGLTAVDVFLRYLFDKPIRGSYELSGILMGLVVAGALGQTAVKRGHVNIDLLTQHLPRRVQYVLSIITNLASLFLFVMITWREVVQAGVMYTSGSLTSELYLPLYPFFYVIAFGFCLLSLAFIVIFFESLLEAVNKWNP